MTAYESVTTGILSAECGACALIQDVLPLYLEGEASPGSRDLIIEHLARCERCASYLAGAQSVRAQLNRERVQRTAVFVGDQPALQAVAFGRRLAMMIVTLALCGLGAVASLLVWSGLSRLAAPTLVVVGVILGGSSFTGLVALAQRGAPFSLARLVSISMLCGLGAFATVLLGMVDRPEMKLLGMILVVAAVIGIWLGVVPERTPAT